MACRLESDFSSCGCGFSSINDSLTRRKSMNDTERAHAKLPFMLSFVVVGLLTVRVLTRFVDDIRRLPY